MSLNFAWLLFLQSFLWAFNFLPSMEEKWKYRGDCQAKRRRKLDESEWDKIVFENGERKGKTSKKKSWKKCDSCLTGRNNGGRRKKEGGVDYDKSRDKKKRDNDNVKKRYWMKGKKILIF